MTVSETPDEAHGGMGSLTEPDSRWAVSVWSGTETVIAEDWRIEAGGVLVLSDGDALVKAYAPHAWYKVAPR